MASSDNRSYFLQTFHTLKEKGAGYDGTEKERPVEKVLTTIILYVAGGLGVLAVLVALIMGKKPVRSLLAGGIEGVCALAAVDILGAFTGVSIGVNLFSGGVCFLLGVPGVIGLLLMKTLFLV